VKQHEDIIVVTVLTLSAGSTHTTTQNTRDSKHPKFYRAPETIFGNKDVIAEVMQSLLKKRITKRRIDRYLQKAFKPN
jgi:hypothetical protein